MKTRIWIDVTDFLKWRGNFTGFQHIQYNMAKEFLASGRETRFFVYDELSRKFISVDFDPDSVSNDGVVIADQVTKMSKTSSKQLLKRITPNIIKRAAKKALSKSGQNVAAAKKTVRTDSPFLDDDIVMVLGGIWHGSFADDLSSEKAKKNFKFVHVVHDMIPVVCPQYVVEGLPEAFSTYKEKIFSIADGLLINSESSKRDAIAFMEERGISVPPSVVFRLADEPNKENGSKPVKALSNKQFILSLGTIEGRKNHALLYYTYKLAAKEGVELPALAIVGRKGWLVDDLLYVLKRDPEIKDKIVVLDQGVTNEERAWLYKNCLFTIWPSFYEGWGMPVAESLAHGKACITTPVSAMPEIAPQLTEYFSPFDSKECLELIKKYLDPKTRSQKEQQIAKNYKITSWHDMLKSIDEFLTNLDSKN